MKITLLCENTSSDIPWCAEWGFSAHIEVEGVRILFDFGYSDIYVRNARQAGIDLNAVDFFALSHNHDDHTRGLLFYEGTERKPLIAHPRVLEVLPEAESSVLKRCFDVRPSAGPREFTPNVFFLGAIPRQTTFEAGTYGDDPMPDDTALAIRTPQGTVVIAGCSHAGICNICDHAKRVTGQNLYAVLGGFHLLKATPDTLDPTLRYFQRERPTHLFPLHCVDFPALVQFHTILGCAKRSAGDVIEV